MPVGWRVFWYVAPLVFDVFYILFRVWNDGFMIPPYDDSVYGEWEYEKGISNVLALLFFSCVPVVNICIAVALILVPLVRYLAGRVTIMIKELARYGNRR